jgi:pilus assembly protein CpaC
VSIDAVKPELSPETMIYMDVKVVEVRKRAVDKLGINWNSSATGPSFATTGYFYANSTFRGNNPSNSPITSAVRPFLSFFGLSSEINSTLNFLEQSGDLWTLAEPKLSSKSGSKARSQVGGEIPIQVAGGLGTNSVVYKPYGVILEFEPVIDDKGQLSSKITIEVSEPDARNSTVSGGVAFTQNKTETNVSMKDGETLVLAGLLKNNGQRSRNEVPGLGKIPVLGGLFRNKEFENERTEVVVLVTPRVSGAQSPENLNRVQESQDKIDDLRHLINKGLAQ